jgi:8-oxo-dGTP pyrophosphatase MutT (NUDIX family)
MKKEYSAGGAVYKTVKKKNKIQTLWLLVKHKNAKGWRFPKGHIEPGENARRAAIREVEEEGKVQAKSLKKIGAIGYVFKIYQTTIKKSVTFFLMKFRKRVNEPKYEEKTVSKTGWFDYKNALRKLRFPKEKEILMRAFRSLKGKEKEK